MTLTEFCRALLIERARVSLRCVESLTFKVRLHTLELTYCDDVISFVFINL